MKDINCQEAYEKLQKSTDVIYLDVRSIPEFRQGHPIRAINIPLMHLMPGLGMVPNADFASVVEANVPKDAHILVGCKAGGRSARACEIMSSIGYKDVTNVRGGFVGTPDNMGRIVEPGWSLLNLPTCTECQEGSDYETLESKAKK